MIEVLDRGRFVESCCEHMQYGAVAELVVRLVSIPYNFDLGMKIREVSISFHYLLHFYARRDKFCGIFSRFKIFEAVPFKKICVFCVTTYFLRFNGIVNNCCSHIFFTIFSGMWKADW